MRPTARRRRPGHSELSMLRGVGWHGGRPGRGGPSGMLLASMMAALVPPPCPRSVGTEALSRQARLRSTALARPKRPSRDPMQPCPDPGRLSLAPPPYSGSRRQAAPDSRPISRGGISWGKPLFGTTRMPPGAARFGRGGQPPFGFARSGGSSGSMRDHNSSDTRGLGKPPTSARPHRPFRSCSAL
jgi:hypothetical protein